MAGCCWNQAHVPCTLLLMADADDAESTCGSPRCNKDDGGACMLDCCNDPTGCQCVTASSSQQQQLKAAASSAAHMLMVAGQPGQVAGTAAARGVATAASNSCTSSQQDGDDFEALDDSILMEGPMTYPGGVEAALADWQAAVSSRAAVLAAADAAAAEASSSSCCNYSPQPPPPQPAFICQQQPQQQKQQQLCHAGSLMPSQQQQQPQPQAPSNRLAAAAGPSTQQCPFAAFKGDVVGAVLAGLVPLPTPSCDSSEDDWIIMCGCQINRLHTPGTRLF